MKKQLLLTILSITIGITNLYSQTPAWQWATSAGGAADISPNSVCVDYSGNSYITGKSFYGSVTFGGITVNNSYIGYNIVIAKYDAAGNTVWAKILGGDDYDAGTSISVDTLGNAYVTGFFQSGHIDFGGMILFNPDSASGNEQYFIAKYNTNGNLIWAKTNGNCVRPGNTEAHDIIVDAVGNSYVVGDFGLDTVTFDNFQLINSDTASYGDDVFIVAYDSSGSVKWASSAGSTYAGGSASISIDHSGHLIVSGSYNSYAGMSFGNISIPGATDFDGFVAKYDITGQIIWVKKIGGGNRDFATSATVDDNDNIYVTGVFKNDTIVFGNDTLFNSGGFDAFVLKFDSSGNAMWGKGINGFFDEISYNIQATATGIFLIGYFTSNQITFGNSTLTKIGQTDVYIIKCNSSGTAMWSENIGGMYDAYGYDIACDKFGNLYVTGNFDSPTLTVGSLSLTNNVSPSADLFLIKANEIVGINEVDNENLFKVFPNPTSGAFSILFKKDIQQGTLSVYNALGECVYYKQINGEHNDIPVYLNKGIYFVSVIEYDRSWCRKLIVQ
jgi:hypothetical protein